MELKLPTGWEWLGVPVGALTALIAGIPAVFIGLLALQALDLVTGVLAALKVGEPLAAPVMRDGIVARSLDWCLIFGVSLLGWIAPEQIGQLGLLPATGLAMAFAVHEVVSIFDNRRKSGGWVPQAIRTAMEAVPTLGPLRGPDAPNGHEQTFIYPAPDKRGY